MDAPDKRPTWPRYVHYRGRKRLKKKKIKKIAERFREIWAYDVFKFWTSDEAPKWE